MRVLVLRAEVRAWLWSQGEYETVADALAPLFHWAVRKGLVARHGEADIKTIIERPFVELLTREDDHDERREPR